MQVILLERIEKLGQMGDVVNVKPGFARNFLLPKGKALRATEENISHFDAQKTQMEAQNLERKSEAKAVSTKMDGTTVILVRQAGEAGQLYGSVNARDIAQALRDDGFNVSRNQVRLDQPIKNLGLHDLSVMLHPEVSITVTANVARSEDEAEIQAETGRALLSQAEEETLAASKTAEAAEVVEFAADEAVAEQAGTMFEDGAAPEATVDESPNEAGDAIDAPTEDD